MTLELYYPGLEPKIYKDLDSYQIPGLVTHALKEREKHGKFDLKIVITTK